MKLDNVLSELSIIRQDHKKEIKSITKNFKSEISSLNDTIKDLNNTISKLREDNKKLLDEIDRLKNSNNKNSTNSSKPSSTNITTPKKKTGANLYNYRVKTGNKIGGQYGHVGHNLSKEYIEGLIENKKIEARIFKHTINGSLDEKDTIKYRLGIEIKPYVEKHIFKHTLNSNKVLPKDFYTDVTYNNSIKALSIELGAYNVISYDRLSDFFSVITDNIINISNSSLVNILYEFSNKSELTLNKLEEDILNSKNLFTDETGTKFNKKNIFVINYSNKNTVLYKAHKSKGHKPILEDNILPKFCGGIMGDHDTTLQKYGVKNYECNIHLGRYLEELIQNISNIQWAKDMKEFLFRVNNTRKIAISFGLKNFDQGKIVEYDKEYDKI